MDEQGGWQRSVRIELGTDESSVAALVARRETTCGNGQLSGRGWKIYVISIEDANLRPLNSAREITTIRPGRPMEIRLPMADSHRGYRRGTEELSDLDD